MKKYYSFYEKKRYQLNELKVSLKWEGCTTLLWFMVRYVITYYILNVLCNDEIT